jgi:multicomponent Na+:H+ antiporter subunit C
MISVFLYALVGVGLLVLGIYALIVRAHLLRKILAINVMATGVFLVLVALAARDPEVPPDPVPHAMVITGIVVAVSASALALILMLKVYAATEKDGLRDRKQDQ